MNPGGYVCHACGGTNGSMTLMDQGWEHDEPIYCAWAERDRYREVLEGIAGGHDPWPAVSARIALEGKH